MRLFSTFFILTLITTASVSQDKFGAGYYVTNTSDSIRGFIQYKAYYSTGFKFRQELNGFTQYISVDEFKSFRAPSGVIYEMVEYSGDADLPSTPILIQPVVRGEVDLFYYMGNAFIGSDRKGRFALADKKPSSSEDATKKYQKNIGAFNILFQDCPEVKEKAQNTLIGEESLIELLRSYHECRELPYKVFKPKKLKRFAHVGVFAGLAASNLSFSKSTVPETRFLNYTNFEASLFPTFGVVTTLGGRSPSPILTFQSELTYTKADFKGTYSFTEPDFAGYDIAYTSTTSVVYSRLSLSAGLRITARSNRLNPYVSLSLAGQHFMSLEGGVHQVSTINSVVKEEDSDLGMKKSPSAILVAASAGLKKKIAANDAVFVECSFENTSISTEIDLNARVSAVAFRVGFMF